MAGHAAASLREYLGRAFDEDRPWDQIFRELMLADETDPSRKGAAEFLKAAVERPRPADQRRQLGLLRRERELRQVPRPPAGRRTGSRTTSTA